MEGCPSILGVWVPLNYAQEFVQNQTVVPDVLNAFLSNTLHEDFPCSIRNLHRSHEYLRSLQQLGPPFRSMVERQPCLSTGDPTVQIEIGTPVPPVSEGGTLDTPLSMKEEEIFQALCAYPDWETPSPGSTPEPNSKKRHAEERPTPAVQRSSRTIEVSPLRRSKRVAEALASRPRKRSGKNRA